MESQSTNHILALANDRLHPELCACTRLAYTSPTSVQLGVPPRTRVLPFPLPRRPLAFSIRQAFSRIYRRHTRIYGDLTYPIS